MRRDKEERYGKKFEVRGDGTVAEVGKVDPPIEKVKQGINAIKTLYTEDRAPGVAKTAFKTLGIYLKNVLREPKEDKFQKINLGNEAF